MPAAVVISVAFSPDGTTLAASDASGAIRLWDRATGQTIRTFSMARSGPVTDIAFSPDSATLAAANEDGPVRLWPTDGRRSGEFDAQLPFTPFRSLHEPALRSEVMNWGSVAKTAPPLIVRNVASHRGLLVSARARRRAGRRPG